ncbi:MAG: PEP-CTERM system histidine kinase PrsK [Kiritimatiellae bacterium]|nr:PEP-CTERM system histidine kinase PrsK [Kiritimatiellia bacterium]
MSVEFLVPLIAAALAIGMAGFVLAHRQRSFSHKVFSLGMVILALEGVFTALASYAILPEDILKWQQLRVICTALIPGVWLVFCLCYARGDYMSHLARWKWVLPVLLLGPVAVAVGGHDHIFDGVRMIPRGVNWGVPLGSAGRLVHFSLLLSCVAMLVGLERTFHSAVGTMKWRIKFMVIGLGVLFCMRIYTSTHALLYSLLDTSMDWLNSGALIAAGVLVSWSIRRGSLSGIDVYLSHRALYRSVTLIFVGIYLVATGLLARLVSHLGGASAATVKTFVIFLALAFLAMLLASDRFRQRVKHVIALHLCRPQYDYRDVWARFSERTASGAGMPDFCREVAKLVSETIEALSVTIWVADESRKRFVLGGSTALTEKVGASVEQGPAAFDEIIEGLRTVQLPLDLHRSREGWVELLNKMCPTFFPEGGHCLCVPLSARGNVVGIMVVGDRVSGLPYTLEEYELIKTIADHVAATLLGFRLSERLSEAKQLEAFQAMSAFFVHDLKNVVATLSLILGNLPMHYSNPAFREDVLQAVSKSVERMNSLISRLSRLREGMTIRRVESDLNAIVASALNDLVTGDRLVLKRELHPLPKLAIDEEQIRRVIINLVLNACAPSVGSSVVRVATEAHGKWACLSVSDNGCGMSRAFVENSLFRPFQSTKKDGLGIGLFQSRMIVEAHGGRIEVETEEGKGSTFRVWLPIAGG